MVKRSCIFHSNTVVKNYITHSFYAKLFNHKWHQQIINRTNRLHLSLFRFYGMSIWFPEYVRKLQEEKYDQKAITYSNRTVTYKHFSGVLANHRFENIQFLNNKFEDLVLNHCVFSDCVFENSTFDRIHTSRSFFYHSKFVRVTFEVSINLK